jgi:hypothetical protein
VNPLATVNTISNTDNALNTLRITTKKPAILCRRETFLLRQTAANKIANGAAKIEMINQTHVKSWYKYKCCPLIPESASDLTRDAVSAINGGDIPTM